MRDTAARQRAWQRGRWAERVCRWRLLLSGYRIVGIDLRTPVGEVDILARRGQTLVIVEVKARTDLGAAAESIGPRQRRRIRRAADWLRAGRPEWQALDLRFDVMLVAPWRWPTHVHDAWREEA
jgi:putative endonuclease